ncbi:MAG: hypothetical protein NC483_03620 [Ruminococcus sp.]|nr:hypothetical protein [Ruminococcus sp.]
MKRDLLEMKKGLLSLALAGAFVVTLSGCGTDQTAPSNGDTSNNIVEETEKKDALILFEEGRAVIVYADSIIVASNSYHQDSYYSVYETEPTNSYISPDLQVPVANAVKVSSSASFTAEEYIEALKGPDFPIVYLNNDNNLTR